MRVASSRPNQTMQVTATRVYVWRMVIKTAQFESGRGVGSRT
jgi:hypothetical protein